MTEHVPAPIIVTVLPDIVHTTGVVEAKLIGSPELAVADSKNGAVPAGTLFSVANVIVCTVVVITGGVTDVPAAPRIM